MESRVTRILNRVSGRNYLSIMYWHSLPATRNITTSSNYERAMLKTLLAQMRHMAPTAAMYRVIQTRRFNGYKIVGRGRLGQNRGTHYRIDNQIPVDLTVSDPKLNLHYQIGDNSHAMVVVHMKPKARPVDREGELDLIDEGDLSFQPETVMGFIEDAMQYSAENDCYTHIEWFIVEVEEENRERRRRSSVDQPRINVAESMVHTVQHVLDSQCVRAISVCGLQLAAKTIVQIAAELAIKECATVTAKAGSKTLGKELLGFGAKTTATKIPLVGLLVGGAFGACRLLSGDVQGAGYEIISGAASCFPGPGTAASVAIDLALCARDINRASRHDLV